MSNVWGNESFFSTVNVWGEGPILTTLRVSGQTFLNTLEVIGKTIFKNIVQFTSAVNFEELPTTEILIPYYDDELTSKKYVDDSIETEINNAIVSLLESENEWTGVNYWDANCSFNMGSTEHFHVGSETNLVGNFQVYAEDSRVGTNFSYIEIGEDTIKLETLEIELIGNVSSTSITNEIADAIEPIEGQITGLETEIGTLQGEMAVVQGEIEELFAIASGEGGAVAVLQGEVSALQNDVNNTSGGGQVDTAQVRFFQKNGSGNNGSISMVDASGQTKLRMNVPVDFDKSIYIDTDGYIDCHGDIDIRSSTSAFKGKYLRAFNPDNPLHLGIDAGGNNGQVWIEGTINTFTKSIPRLKDTLYLIPTLENELVSKKYVDDYFVTLATSQTISGLKTFSVALPQSTLTPSDVKDLTTKAYVDNNFCSLTGNQTITGNKIFWPTTGTTTIRGSQADIFADVTFLTGNTTTISGVNCNITSTTNYIAGTTTNLRSPNINLGLVKATAAETFCYLQAYKVIVDSTVYSFYVDAEISNFVGDQTLLQSPYVAVSSICDNFRIESDNTVITSPYVAITNDCTSLNLNATNTSITGNATAVTQVNTDNSTKLATTQFVNSFGNANYITLSTGQTVTGLKTFSTNLPQSTLTPGDNKDFTTKAYVDTAASAYTSNAVLLTGTQTVEGLKTFSTNLPRSSLTPSDGNDFTNKTYVDNHSAAVGAVLLTGDQTLTTGIKTFQNLPQSTAVPTDVKDLTTKSYVDNNFCTLAGNQTITGNKIFWPTTGTTVIRGSQADIFADVTFLTGDTTTISGVNCNITSTTNYIAGTTTNLRSTNINLGLVKAPTAAETFCYLQAYKVIVDSNVYSLYIDAEISNFVGDQTLLQSPYIAVSSLCDNFNIQSDNTVITSPYVAITDACTSLNLNATNTFITGTATATTQAITDDSTKLATTAFVKAFGNANYMTLTTNQNVSGVKTYSTKQIFNAGTACSTYDNISLTDMSIAGNSGNGILTVANGRIISDVFGVTLAETLNLQLNEGTFIQPNPSLSPINEPVFTFGLNQSQGYVDIVGVPRSAQATRKINTGIFSWFAGNNQSTTFTITHSIVTTYHAGVGTMYEAEVYFYFQDVNTGIIRYTTGNLATTTGFTLLPNSTVVRPTITFTLTTATIPQGAYSIFGYSRVTDAYSSSTGILSVNWNLASPTSSFLSTQNYNTPLDYTFTSRNLYHCFRNYVAGVYIVNNIATQQNIMTPLFYSVSDFTNMMVQPTTSGAVSTPAVTGGTAVGNFTALSVNNADNYYLVYPNYSLILYDTVGWVSPIYINFKNITNNPVMVAPTTTQRGSSCRIYFDEVELIKY